MTRRIQTDNPHERAFKLPWMDEKLEWDDDQTAAVGEADDAVDPEVAERLVEGDDRSDISYADADRCTVIKSDGEECGRELPCRYHSGGGENE